MKKKIILVIMFSLIISPLSFVRAEQGGNGNSNRINSEKKAEFKGNRQDAKEEKCKNIESRIEAKLNKYENGNVSVEDAHKRLRERIRNMITRLENNGIDAEKLKTDLATLEQNIEQVAASYGTFVAALKESQTYACGESQGQFRIKLQEAKRLMINVRTERKETRNFVVNTIIPDIKNLREQIGLKIQDQNKVQTQNKN